MKMRLIRIKPAGNEYAIPDHKYSDLPCFRVADGMPARTSFEYSELKYLLDNGRAEVVGEVELTFKLVRNEA